MVAISPDAKDAWLHSPRRDPQPLRDLSPDRLLAAIRDAVEPRRRVHRMCSPR
jgi:hypothetical protein